MNQKIAANWPTENSNVIMIVKMKGRRCSDPNMMLTMREGASLMAVRNETFQVAERIQKITAMTMRVLTMRWRRNLSHGLRRDQNRSQPPNNLYDQKWLYPAAFSETT